MHTLPSDWVSSYLKRIGYSGPLEPSAGVLTELQKRHVMSVPYENFDILAQRPVSLELQDVFEKIVVQGRGGYCFELNRIFAALLRELGFEVVDYVARFWRDEAQTPPKHRHHVLGVRAATRTEWLLSDVGVGGVVPRLPLRIVADLEQPQGVECYRFERDLRFGLKLLERRKGAWSCYYSFREEPQELNDFEFAHYWCQHAPQSPFRKAAIACVHTPLGRNTLAGSEFRFFINRSVETFTPQTPEAFRAALETHFGIRLPVDFGWPS